MRKKEVSEMKLVKGEKNNFKGGNHLDNGIDIQEETLCPSKPSNEESDCQARVEEEVRIISEHLCEFVVNELMNEFMDEICDEEEILRHKELHIKEIMKGDESIEKVEVEQLLMN